MRRSVSGQEWVWRAAPLPLGEAARLGVDDVTAALLLARGADRRDVPRLIRPRLVDWLPDPSAFRDMDRAAARLADAVERGERLCLFTDYDVDGATSAALLLRTLRALGLEPTVWVPDRLLEGYGPSEAAIRAIARAGARLVVLLDCGSHAHRELAEARALGLEAIVVDHHQAPTELPPALAVVNPNRFDEQADRGIAAAHGTLCTAGLAFLLAVACLRELRRRGRLPDPAPDLGTLLDLVALGTVADVMPLSGLNRCFVALGLRRLARGGNVGLAALLEVAKLARAEAADLGFHLGPRINAGGRIGDSSLGVRLLATDDPAEARALAAELDRLNRERRRIEAEVTEAALAALDPEAPVAVAAGPWHPGVVGIVASRLCQRLDRPAVVIALEGTRPARGSARSVPGIDIGAAMLAARDQGLLLAGGGHAMAAGLTIAPDRIDELTRFLVDRLGPAVAQRPSQRALPIDLAVAPAGLSPDLAEALGKAGPYGPGWPEPRVAAGPVRVIHARAVGADGAHVQALAAGPDGGRVRAVLFRGAGTPAGQALLSGRGRSFHLAGSLGRDDWQGLPRVELRLDDLAPAD
ncbi:MAG: single-stranded-DNA-specific exonuclease RecJ [Sphingomonadaceae bacterium]|nr:single-stranded-DNA-specific exonuclease RecJ [Sphingomonadaceae bacterium]MDW8415191.1 single-stranded-DNA-specific exonuclease RecJ [Thermaurantiacus sp.]